MTVASKLILTIPLILIAEIRREKMIPDITGAGIAYFRKREERATMARPKKITIAANPRVHKYSNLKVAIAPSAAGV